MTRSGQKVRQSARQQTGQQSASPMFDNVRVRAEGRFTLPADCDLVSVLQEAQASDAWTLMRLRNGHAGEMVQLRFTPSPGGSYDAQIRHADGRYVAENSHLSMGLISEDGRFQLAVEVTPPHVVGTTMGADGTFTIPAGTSLAEVLKRCGAEERGWVRMDGGGEGTMGLPMSDAKKRLKKGQALVARFYENPDGSFTGTLCIAEGPEEAMPDYLRVSNEHLPPPPPE